MTAESHGHLLCRDRPQGSDLHEKPSLSAAAEKITYLCNDAGTRIALHHIPAAQRNRGVVLLSHGTFSNHRACRGLAQYLAADGLDCWILDFQGHGKSDRPAIVPDFESMCLLDSRAALDRLQSIYPDQQVNWIGHSGGGLAILMLLARYPDYRERIAKIVTVASQATDAAKSKKNRLAIQAASLATVILGHAPGKPFRIGPENEFGAVMQQWYGWSLSGRWSGSDGFDYEAMLSELSAPALMLAAKADRFIAPESGCERLFRAYGAADKSFFVCGVDTGCIEDYTHARIISSRHAAKDIWPLIARWI